MDNQPPPPLQAMPPPPPVARFSLLPPGDYGATITAAHVRLDNLEPDHKKLREEVNALRSIVEDLRIENAGLRSKLDAERSQMSQVVERLERMRVKINELLKAPQKQTVIQLVGVVAYIVISLLLRR